MNERIRYLGGTNQRGKKRTVQVKKENDPDISFSVTVVHRKALILLESNSWGLVLQFCILATLKYCK